MNQRHESHIINENVIQLTAETFLYQSSINHILCCSFV